MILNIHHSTIYDYIEPVQLSVQSLRLTPFNHQRQRVISWHLQTPVKTTQHIDWFGNITQFLSIPEGLTKIEIVAIGQVEVALPTPNTILGLLPAIYYLRSTPLSDINQDMKDLTIGIELNIATANTDQILAALGRLSARILAAVPYTRGTTDATTTATKAFNLAAGVCQDHAHIFLSCCRFLGIPARYVSGYLHTDDASHLASHAWAEAWVNHAWHSFDISNQCSAGEHHIELAYGLDYLDACPVRGSRIGGGCEKLSVVSLVTGQ